MSHVEYLRRANEIARKAVMSGNTPFGALLVDENGDILLESGNEAFSLHDETAHAERVLASRASQRYSKDKLWKCRLYTTVEPCPMCTGAIYWANIGTIVYGMSEKRLLEMTGSDDKNPTFDMGCESVIKAGQKDIKILGPFKETEDEIASLHASFWKKESK